MEYGILILLLIIAALGYMEISRLRLQIKKQQAQLDRLCQATRNEGLSESFIPDKLKDRLIDLKKSGKTVKAVRELRENTSMDLLEAKKYIDAL